MKRLKRPFAVWPLVVRFARPFRSKTRHYRGQAQTISSLRRRVPAWSLLALLLVGAGIGFTTSAFMGQLDSGHGSNSPDFTLASNPAVLTVPQGQLATFVVSMDSLNGFAGSVNLNVSSNPAMLNATYDLNPASVSLFSGSASATLTIDVPPAALVRDYFLTLEGSSSRLLHRVTIIMQVTVPPSPDFQLQATPSAINVTRGSSVTATVTLTSIAGFSGIVNMSATVSPNGVNSPTTSLNPNKVTLLSGGTASVVLTATTTISTNRGSYTIVVQGISGSLSNTVAISLVVQ